MERVWRFSESREMVERECLLFEAGDYPDKGVTISEADLREIAQNSDETIPVKIEHLPESPFDRVLGVVTGLRAVGSQLWGTLRQSKEAWELMQRAGARALSIGLDVAGKRIVETSLVCRPRVAKAQVFHREDLREKRGRERNHNVVQFTRSLERGEVVKMLAGVRSAAEGLRDSLKRFLNDAESETDIGSEFTEVAEFSREREALARDRAQFREERAAQKIRDWKRAGLMRGNEAAETTAKALLLSDTGTVQFGEERVSVSDLFAKFVEANGAVIPMGERIAASPEREPGAAGAQARLMELTEARVRAEGTPYAVAFAAVANAHPDLAQRAREE